MKIVIKEAAKTICSNENSIHKYFGWPSVARLQDNSLAMVASGFRLSHICPFGKLIMSKSFDEGKTWSSPSVIIDTPLDDRDGGICPFGNSGVVVTSFNNSIEFQRKYGTGSDYRNAYLDEVSKLDNPEELLGSTIAISNDCGNTFSTPMNVPISSPHGPCVLSDGTIFYVGRKFADDNNGYHIECHVLNPDGTTAFRSRIKDVSTDLLSCEPHAIQLPNGNIIVHIRVQSKDTFTTYQSISTDMGYTFSDPIALLDVKGGAPAHLLMHSSGTLISVYGYREAPFGIRAMFSDDNGENWDTNNIIADDYLSSDLGYPCSVELENSDILTVFYARVGNNKHTVIRSIIWNFEKD